MNDWLEVRSGVEEPLDEDLCVSSAPLAPRKLAGFCISA